METATTMQKNEIVINQTPVDDSLGGLDLLCALAEQRILEENEKPKADKEKSRDRERRREKGNEPKRKRMKSDRHHEDREHRKREKYYVEKIEAATEKRQCICQEENYKTYKSPESEEEVRKFIASKTQSICCKGDWPCMNAMELDMRMKLAELQRQYREKQKELSKLKPKKHSSECSKKRSRKKIDSFIALR
ncbi:hypothetical protein NQ317_005610 [Molorchus minor]|uniref:Uncharacterized protein n=1 Tax=Molorchus minor TaxID=1323400 RepID=A0ABQ9K934_9CUCU|nr:hypothetical protein NQ317_005610 [Molorchus minor]